MSVFQEHGRYSADGFETAEAGGYTCSLISVDHEMRPKFNEPSQVVPQFRWTFEAVDAWDSAGQPFNFVKFTGTSYGFETANLTKLINTMFGRALTADEYARLDIPMFQRRQYLVVISLETNGKGAQVNKIQSVSPVRAAAQQPPAAAPQAQSAQPAQPQQRPPQYQQAAPAAAPQQRQAPPSAAPPQAPFRNTAPAPQQAAYASQPQAPAPFDDSDMSDLEDPFAE